MQQKTVYQTDFNGFFLYPTVAHELPLQEGTFNIPYGASENEPPPAGEGQVARNTDIGWQVVEDHRQDALYYVHRTATEDKPAVLLLYPMGATLEVNDVDMSYDGGGPIPDWLTATPPDPETTQPDDQE